MNLKFNLICFSALMVVLIGFVSCASKPMNEGVPVAQIADKKITRNPATNSWANYHWARTTAQFTLKVGDNLTTREWKTYLQSASSDWNSPQAFGATSTPLLTALVVGPGSKRCSMVSGTTQVCNGKYGNNGWLGLASINISGDHITQGTAKMNDTYFATSKYNNPNEKLHVVCQEVAHTFGLDHQSVDGSSLNTCMDYFSNTGVNALSTASTRPNLHDFDELNLIYSHVDGSTTVAPQIANVASNAMDDEITNNSETWGDYNREQSHGQSAYYERYHHDGSKSLTHVYWTEEKAANCENCDHRFDRN